MDKKLTAVQRWYRSYSYALLSSYSASAAFTHDVTIGESREAQVVQMLQLVLPTKHTLFWRVVIVSAPGTQSPSFDGALVDRANWPLLYAQEGTVVAAMVESVAMALEIKSDLSGKDIKDIFEKTRDLHLLRSGFLSTVPVVPVSGFTYQCSNPYLALFDFSVAAMADAYSAPREICILNKGVLCHADVGEGKVSLRQQADRKTVPILLQTGEDSLLLWVHLLCRGMGSGEARSEVFRGYSEGLYSDVRALHFDVDFLQKLRDDSTLQSRARKSFERKADNVFDDLYRAARAEIGLE